MDFGLYHWHSADRPEIDILAEVSGGLVGMEVKCAVTIDDSDFRHLKWFAREGPGKTRRFTGIVIYLGERTLSFGNRLFALPASLLWSRLDL